MTRVLQVDGRSGRVGEDEDDTDHFCPGCGVRQKFFARYPWYFCPTCVAQAEDGEGRRLLFYNPSPAGGLGWRYADDQSLRDECCGSIICLIRGREVVVHEARFGGVVAEPREGFSAPPGNQQGLVRLVGGPDVLARTRERLKPA